MSVKPIIKEPKELTKTAQKVFHAVFFKTMKKLRKKHQDQETAVPCYLQTDAPYTDGKGFLLLAGKMKTWKKHAQEHATKDNALRGYCFLTEEKDVLVINVMPVAGKLKSKEDIVQREMKAVVAAAKMQIRILPGTFTDKVEDDDDDDDDDEDDDDNDDDVKVENNAPQVVAELPKATAGQIKKVQTDTVNLLTTPNQLKALNDLVSWLDGSEFAKIVKELQAIPKIKDENLRLATFQTLRTRILEWLEKHKNDNSSAVKKRCQALSAYLQQYDKALETLQTIETPITASVKLSVEGLQKSTTFFSSGYNDIVKSIEEFNKMRNPELKKSRALRLYDMISDWIAKHSGEADNRLNLLKNTLSELKKMLGEKPEHVNKKFKNANTKIVHADAGSQQASDAIQDVLSATEHERAAKIAALLQAGKGKNDDATFGALMKMLGAGLEEHYTKATQSQFGKPNHLLVDINAVFGQGSLRTQYLTDIINEYTNPYATLALKLGLLGKTWFNTAEDGDFIEALQKQFSAAQIETMMAATDVNTYEGAISQHVKKRWSSTLQRHIDNEIRKKKANELMAESRKAIQDAPNKPFGFKEVNKYHPNDDDAINEWDDLHEQLEEMSDTDPKRAEMEKRKATLEQEARAAYVAGLAKDLEAPNDAFLHGLVKDMEADSLLGRVEADKLIDQVLDWANGASAPEITQMLESKKEDAFIIKLQKMTSAMSVSGFSDTDLAFLRGRLEGIRDRKTGKFTEEASGDMMGKVSAIMERRKLSKKTALKEKLGLQIEAGEEIIEAILGSGVEDMPLAIIEKYGSPQDVTAYKEALAAYNAPPPTVTYDFIKEMNFDDSYYAKKWKKLKETPPSDDFVQERKRIMEIESIEAAVLQRHHRIKYGELENTISSSMKQFDAHLADCGVSTDLAKDISDTIYSNGAKGKTYRTLFQMALSKVPAYNLGDEVYKLLLDVELGSPEYVAIQNDIAMLEALKQKITRGMLGVGGITGNSDGEKAWTNIAKYLQLSGKLADPSDRSDVDGSKDIYGDDALDNLRGMRKHGGSELLTQKEIQEKAEKVKTLKQNPAFWATRLSHEYRNDNSTSAFTRILFEAQTAGVPEVLRSLKALDESAYEHLTKKAAAGDPTLQKLMGGGKASGLDVLKIQTRKADEKLLGKRTVKIEALNQIIESVSPEELVREWFDFKGLKEALEQKKKGMEVLKNGNLTPENQAKAKKTLAKIEAKIRRFDLTPDARSAIAGAASNKNALELLESIRGKVIDELSAEGDNETKQLFKDAGMSDADIKLLAQRVEAVNKMEREVALEEGLQWSSVTSRTLNRDEAVATFARQNWAVNDKIAAISLLSEEDQEEEKNIIADNLSEALENMQEAQDKFEESKTKYNGYVKTAVSILVQAAITAATLASGVGAARGIIELLWSVGASVFKNAATGIVSKYIDGGQTNAEFWYNFAVDQVAKTGQLVAGHFLGNAMSMIKMDGVASFLTEELKVGGKTVMDEGWFLAKESDIAYELFDVGDMLGMAGMDYITSQIKGLKNGQKIENSDTSLFGQFVFDQILDIGLDEGFVEMMQENAVEWTDGEMESARALFLAKQMDLDVDEEEERGTSKRKK